MASALAPHQAALYDAEAETIDRLGLRWRRRADVQAYVDALVESAWFFERWPTLVRCTVERRGSGAVWSACQPLDTSGPGATPTEGVILLADGCLSQPVVLHELAHLLLPAEVGHRPAFAETLLTLVRHEMGFFAFADLFQALRRSPLFAGIREGVDYAPSYGSLKVLSPTGANPSHSSVTGAGP